MISNKTFEHRINGYHDGQFMNVIDAINPSLERAEAIADLLEVAAESKSARNLSTNSLWRVAEAIQFEIKDARALLIAYDEETQANKQEVQP